MAPMACCLLPLRVCLDSLVFLFLIVSLHTGDASAVFNSGTWSTTVTIESGAGLMEANSMELSTFDAFASEIPEYMTMSLAEGSGCTVSGLSLQYVFADTAAKTAALTVDVDILNTTVTAESWIASSLSAAHLEDMIGTHGNEFFLDIFCRHPAAFLFPQACAFFAPSNLARLCFGFAPLLRTPHGRSFGALSIDDPFVLHTNDLRLLHGDMRFDLQSARGSPCRPSGVSMRYEISERDSALEVDVSPVTVKVWVNTLMARVFDKLELGDLVGTHTYEVFLSKVCGKATKQALPKACDFFAPSHLGGVCDSLSSLLWQRADVRDFDFRLVDVALPIEEDPFMLRPAKSTAYTYTGTPLHLFSTARASPCTPSGLLLRYFHSGAALALEVEVLHSLTKATASKSFSAVLSKAGLLDIVGSHSSAEFRDKMCRAQGKHLFPYACNFFAPQHLGSLCSSLSMLLAESAHTWLKLLE